MATHRKQRGRTAPNSKGDVKMTNYEILDRLGMIEMTEDEFDEVCSSLITTMNLVDEITTMNSDTIIEKLLIALLYKGE